METASQRRNGTIPLNREAFTDALLRRGMSGSELARFARVTPETFNRAMRGYPVYPRTARRLMDALMAIPVAVGSEVLLGGNGQNDAPKPDDRVETKDSPVAFEVRKRRPLWPDEGIPPEFVNGLRVIDLTPKPKRKPAASRK